MLCSSDNKVPPFFAAEAHGNGGYTLLKLVIVIILVVVLMTVALTRFLPLRGTAENAHIQTTLGGLRSALGLETARRILTAGPSAAMTLANTNPMTLLEEKPAGYIGEATAGPGIEPGQWFFDPENKALYYRLRYPQYREQSPGPPVYLAWRIQATFDDKNHNGTFDAGTDQLRGIHLPLNEQLITKDNIKS